MAIATRRATPPAVLAVAASPCSLAAEDRAGVERR